MLFIALGRHLETVHSVFQSGRQSSTHIPTPASTSSMWEAVTWVTATTAAQSVWVVVFCFFFWLFFLVLFVCLLLQTLVFLFLFALYALCWLSRPYAVGKMLLWV